MYLLSIVGVIVMTVVMGFISGLDVGNLFDFISLLLLLLLLIPMLISGGLFKDFNNAFRLGIGKRQPVSLMELKRAKEAVCLAIKESGGGYRLSSFALCDVKRESGFTVQSKAYRDVSRRLSDFMPALF